MRRMVRMTFKEDNISEFLRVFQENKESIAGFPGCNHVELLRHKEDGVVFFTYSIWETPQALESYRHSSLFKSVWKQTKALFSSPAEAWSMDLEDAPGM